MCRKPKYKVTVKSTLKQGFVVGKRSMPGNPYDGHTLEEAIEQVCILADQTPLIRPCHGNLLPFLL
jgi:IS5 family transposase